MPGEPPPTKTVNAAHWSGAGAFFDIIRARASQSPETTKVMSVACRITLNSLGIVFPFPQFIEIGTRPYPYSCLYLNWAEVSSKRKKVKADRIARRKYIELPPPMTGCAKKGSVVGVCDVPVAISTKITVWIYPKRP